MNLKIILASLLIIVAVAIGYFAFVKNSTVNNSTLYASREECEQKTGKQCYLFRGLCQVAEAQNQKEAEENEKFLRECLPKIGTWQPIETATNQQEPLNEPKTVQFEKINLHSDWGLKESFNYSTYKGVFRSEVELKQVWSYMWNALEEEKAIRRNKTPENQPILPIIDFSKHSVIWYANRGSNASAVTMNKIVEFDNLIEIHVTVHSSDFITSNLNLWTIPKTSKPVQFVESQEYDGGI